MEVRVDKTNLRRLEMEEYNIEEYIKLKTSFDIKDKRMKIFIDTIKDLDIKIKEVKPKLVFSLKEKNIGIDLNKLNWKLDKTEYFNSLMKETVTINSHKFDLNNKELLKILSANDLVTIRDVFTKITIYETKEVKNLNQKEYSAYDIAKCYDNIDIEEIIPVKDKIKKLTRIDEYMKSRRLLKTIYGIDVDDLTIQEVNFMDKKMQEILGLTKESDTELLNQSGEHTQTKNAQDESMKQ